MQQCYCQAHISASACLKTDALFVLECVTSNQNGQKICLDVMENKLWMFFIRAILRIVFIRWKTECSIQLRSASLNRTFHLSTNEYIRTISLINIHYLYSILLVQGRFSGDFSDYRHITIPCHNDIFPNPWSWTNEKCNNIGWLIEVKIRRKWDPQKYSSFSFSLEKCLNVSVTCMKKAMKPLHAYCI